MKQPSSTNQRRNGRILVILDHDFFKNNPARLFRMRKALIDLKFQDEHLEDLVLVRRFIREGLGFRSKITQASCDALKEYLRSYGGVEAYLRRPLFLENIYIAMAVYNLRIQLQIDDLTSFSNLTIYEAQRLLSELLEEEEIADEVGAEVYRSVCCHPIYKRAEEAVAKNVGSNDATAELVELVKKYLRDYVKTEIAKLSLFEKSLIVQSTNSPNQPEPIIQQPTSETQQLGPLKEPKPSRRVLAKVKRRTFDLPPDHRLKEINVNPAMETETTTAEKPDENNNNNDNVNDKESTDKLSIADAKSYASLLRDVNRQRNQLKRKHLHLERREIEMVNRELALELREMAIAFRERLLESRCKLYAETLGF